MDTKYGSQKAVEIVLTNNGKDNDMQQPQPSPRRSLALARVALAILLIAWPGESQGTHGQLQANAAIPACPTKEKFMSNEKAATVEPLYEHPAARALRSIHGHANCRHEVEAQLGEEVWLPLGMEENEYDDMMRLAAEIRDLIFEDGDGTMQGAMIGSAVECLAFAKWWIQRAKGLQPDQEWFAKPKEGGDD